MSNSDSNPTETPDHFAWLPWRELLAGESKIKRFAILGAFGCLIGAILGEFLLAATRPPPPQVNQVCLLIDCSGSMYGGTGDFNKLMEVKQAAEKFAERRDLERDRIAVVGFGNDARVWSRQTGDKKVLWDAINQLSDGGSTNMSAGLYVASEQLPPVEGDRVGRTILLFTDGQPNDPSKTLSAARACREKGIAVVAIGTGDADTWFLADVTGSSSLVFSANSGEFEKSFAQAEKTIYGGSLIESGGLGGSFLRSAATTAAWSALLAAGLALALIMGQNRYAKRSLLGPLEGTRAVGGGFVAGIAGGATGQILFWVASLSGHLPLVGSLLSTMMVPASRVIGWSVLGGLLGWGLAFFVPNLSRKSAWKGGAVGGAIGAGIYIFAQLVSQTAGRLLGAAALGAVIGMLIALIEAVFRSAWLEVRYGNKETIKVNLGATPVKIGGDARACTVYARDARGVAYQYRFENGVVSCVDYATEKTEQVPFGHERTIGAIVVTVRGGQSKSATDASPGGPPRPPPPPAIPGKAKSAATRPFGKTPPKPPAPPAPSSSPSPVAPLAGNSPAEKVEPAELADAAPATPTARGSIKPPPPPPGKPPQAPSVGPPSSPAKSPLGPPKGPPGAAAPRSIRPIPPPPPPRS